MRPARLGALSRNPKTRLAAPVLGAVRARNAGVVVTNRQRRSRGSSLAGLPTAPPLPQATIERGGAKLHPRENSCLRKIFLRFTTTIRGSQRKLSVDNAAMRT
jgi:hypothetical protein